MSIFFKILLCSLFLLPLAAQQSATDYALSKACNCLGSSGIDSLTTEQLEFWGDSCITVALWQNMSEKNWPKVVDIIKFMPDN